MNPVVHFEMPYDDAERVARFYQSAFGWDIQNKGAQMGDYVRASTGKDGPDGWPIERGRINGGFFPRKPDWPAQHPAVVISVDDIQDAMQKVRAAGGKVLGEGEVMEIPGVGKYVAFMDSEGNRVAMVEPMR